MMSRSMDPIRKRLLWASVVVVVAGAAGAGWWFGGAKSPVDAQAARKGGNPVSVVTARVESRDVPVRILANGTVTSVQSVEVRAQVTSTVREVHIREGRFVQKGELLLSLDSRTEEANLRKALAQVEKDRADLATAQRNLERQRELYATKFISQAALDTVQNQVDTLTGQLAIDTAAVEAARVARAFTEIRAPFAGRTGVLNVRAGSLVQPGAASLPLLTVTQIDPITIAFTLPEKELAALQAALAAGSVEVRAWPQGAAAEPHRGRIVFVDNAVDTATGTIRVKAEFANAKAALWPGMYANVELAPRTLEASTVVPAQAVQTGPESRFVYVVGQDGKVAPRPVALAYVEEKFAVVKGVEPGARVVVEGAQNLRPGSAVVEATAPPAGGGEGRKGGKKKDP